MPDVTPYVNQIMATLDGVLEGKPIIPDKIRAVVHGVLVEACDHAAANREQDFERMLAALHELQARVDALEAGNESSVECSTKPWSES